MDSWLREARDRVAAAAGVDASELELDARTIGDLLDLARVAAHESGARVNAPLLCYLVGLAHGRSGSPVAQLVSAGRGGGMATD
jgi:hypothetical protein